MAYIIEQKIGNQIYLYEVESFWDPQKKQARKRKRYLGKKDPITGEVVTKTTNIVCRFSQDYGNIYLIQSVAYRIGIVDILREIFPDDYQSLLNLAFFEISESDPLYMYKCWTESTFLKPNKPMESKQISLFMQKIGEMDAKMMDFFRAWIKFLGKIQTISFDITSISSYSSLLDYVEWGYNRDGENLPQINLGVIYAEDVNMPIFYHAYPGSISDVSTLKNIIRYVSLLDIKEATFILDRGFYSASNISDMKSENFKFIIPMPRSLKTFQVLVTKTKNVISKTINAFVCNNDVLFHVREKVNIGSVDISAHVLFDEKSHINQKMVFLKKLLDLESSVSKQQFQSKRETLNYMSRQVKGSSKFFYVILLENRITLTRKNRVILNYISTMGVTIMLSSNDKLGKENILDLYRRKDHVEKQFDVLKNELDGDRLRVQSKEAMEGRLFVKFIGMIIYSAITNNMKEKNLFAQYTIKEMLSELKKLKIVTMNNGKYFLTETTKRQKDIFREFGVEIPRDPGA